MKNEEKAFRGCGWALLMMVALLVVSNVVLWHKCANQPEPEIIIERDTVYCDTIINRPVASDSSYTGRVIYIRVPVDTARPSTGSGTANGLSASGELTANVGVGPSTCSGTANELSVNADTARPSPTLAVPELVEGRAGDYTIALPVVQKVYRDSMYTAWVSGYEPALDSINLRLPTITERITETIVKPAPRLSVGLQVGAGVGMFQHRPDVYVGIGATYRLWPK